MHVRRLVTSVELTDRSDDDTMSISARHEVELPDGRRLLLLDDRGWSSSGPGDVWTHTSVEDIVSTARTVVGPDEPRPGQTYEDAAANHWATVSRIVGQHGVAVDPAVLRRLPHDVVLGPRLRARLGR